MRSTNSPAQPPTSSGLSHHYFLALLPIVFVELIMQEGLNESFDGLDKKEKWLLSSVAAAFYFMTELLTDNIKRRIDKEKTWCPQAKSKEHCIEVSKENLDSSVILFFVLRLFLALEIKERIILNNALANLLVSIYKYFDVYVLKRILEGIAECCRKPDASHSVPGEVNLPSFQSDLETSETAPIVSVPAVKDELLSSEQFTKEQQSNLKLRGIMLFSLLVVSTADLIEDAYPDLTSDFVDQIIFSLVGAVMFPLIFFAKRYLEDNLDAEQEETAPKPNITPKTTLALTLPTFFIMWGLQYELDYSPAKAYTYNAVISLSLTSLFLYTKEHCCSRPVTAPGY